MSTPPGARISSSMIFCITIGVTTVIACPIIAISSVTFEARGAGRAPPGRRRPGSCRWMLDSLTTPPRHPPGVLLVGLDQACVPGGRRQELIVGPVGDHSALVDIDDLVGQADRGRAIGDHHDRRGKLSRAQAAQNLGLDRRIDRRSGVVEDQEPRACGSGPGPMRSAVADRPTGWFPALRVGCRTRWAVPDMKASAPASRAAFRTSVSENSWPRVMLPRHGVVEEEGLLGDIRHLFGQLGRPRMSADPGRRCGSHPVPGSQSRAISSVSVDLPEAVGPTTARVVPAVRWRSSPSRTGAVSS